MSALVLAVSACSKDEPEVDTTPVTLESEVAGVIGGTEADLAARAGNTVYFEYDKYSLTSEATKTLKKQAAWLKLYPSVNVIVEGHCDDRGTRKYNQALGERRANAAKRYLVAQGVSAKRITTVSYGKDRPAELGSTEAAYAKNRRDVTILAK
jgi:peptidoglycan-associated lipoprotein